MKKENEQKKETIEFVLATERLAGLIQSKKEMALRLKNNYPKEMPKELKNSYEELNQSMKKVIEVEANYLSNLK